MKVNRAVQRVWLSGLAMSFLLTGCTTHGPYHGPISTYYVGGNIAYPQTPLPIQLFVRATGDDPRTRDDLLNVFLLNMKQTGEFANVSPFGAPVIPSLKRLDADIDLKMAVSSKTSPGYVASWMLIVPMFLPGNEITAEGRMTAVIRDDQTVIKSYSAEKTTTSRRNSVGLAYVKIETVVLEKWSRATLTALFDDLISQITNDGEMYGKAIEAPNP